MVKEEERMKVLQVEKRLVDLELAIEEIKKMPESKPDSGTEQRIEDLEDLVMAENAMIVEVKKMLEEGGAGSQGVSTAEADSRIARIESELASFKADAGKTVPEIPELKADIESITKEITNFEADVGKEIRKIKEDIKSAKYSPDIQFLTSKLNTIKNAIDDFEGKRADLEADIGTLEKSVIEMETSARLSKPDGVLKEMEERRKEMIVTNRRLDSLEESVRSVNENVSEKVRNLDTQSIKETLESVGNISGMLNDVRTAHAEIKNKLLEIDKLMPTTLDGRLTKLEDNLRNVVAEVRLDADRSLAKLQSNYDAKLASLEHDVKIAEMQPPQGGLDIEINDLIEKIVFLETRMAALERVFSRPQKAEPVILE